METKSLIPLPNLEGVLRQYAGEVRELYRQHLIEADRLASETLLNSVTTEVTTDEGTYLVTMTLADYWKFVEYDTAPHWPPPSSLLQWIKVKPVLPRPDKKGRLPKPEQLAYLIGRKIAREGTKGSHDVALTVAECNRKFEPLIAEALAADLGAGMHAWILEAMSHYRK